MGAPYSVDQIVKGIPGDLFTDPNKSGERRLKVELGGDVNIGDVTINQPQNGDLGDPAPAVASQVAGQDSAGVLRALLTAADGTLHVTLDDEAITLHASSVADLATAIDTALRATALDVSDAATHAALATLATKLDAIAANQQTDALTDAELRASPVAVDTGMTQPTTPADTQPVSGTVAVTGAQTDALTDAELRASDVEVTLNGEQVDLTRGGSQANLLYVGWSGSQQVTVSGAVSVQTPGNSSISVDATQEGAWTVALDAATLAALETVTVNQGTSPWITADDATASVDDKTPDTAGVWGYAGGVSGTVAVPAGKRVLQLTASAPEAGASVVINGGDSIPIPGGKNFTFEPKANLTAPTIVFTGTDAYAVEYVE